MTLTSRSRPASASGTGRGELVAATATTPSFEEERAIGFRVRDGSSGTIRVFPRGARIDVPGPVRRRATAFARRAASRPGVPAGPAMTPPEPLDREAAIAALLTVRPAEPDRWDGDLPRWRHRSGRRYGGAPRAGRRGHGRRRGAAVRPPRRSRRRRPPGPRSATRWLGLDDPMSPLRSPRPGRPGRCSTPERLGQRGHPGIRHRAPGPRAGARCRRRPRRPRHGRDAAAMRAHVRPRPDLLVVAAGTDAPLLIAAGAPEEVVAPRAGPVPARAAGGGARDRLGDGRGRAARCRLTAATGVAMMAGHEPLPPRPLFAIGSSWSIVGFLVVTTYNAVVALRNRIRQGVGEHRRRAQAAPRPCCPTSSTPCAG